VLKNRGQFGVVRIATVGNGFTMRVLTEVRCFVVTFLRKTDYKSDYIILGHICVMLTTVKMAQN